MKRSHHIIGLLLVCGMLSACNARVIHSSQDLQPAAVTAVDTTPPATDPAVSSASSIDEDQQVVLVDQTYSGSLYGLHGRDWLKGIGTKKITGDVYSASLEIQMNRIDSKGWSGLGMYIAPLASKYDDKGNLLFTYPDESTFGTRLQFLNAQWNGDCHRHLDPASSWGVLHQHDNSLTVDLGDVPMTTGDDGCSKDISQENLLNLINGDGLYLGFMPSTPNYHVKVVLHYAGNVTVSPF